MILIGIIVFLASILGALSGLGSGVLLKPLFDFMGFYTLDEISLYAPLAVLTMAVASVIMSIRGGAKVEKELVVSLGIGAIVGGLVGNQLFIIIREVLNNDSLLVVIQSSILALLMILVLLNHLLKNLFPKIEITNNIIKFVVGIVLGLLAVFLSIGGGPINALALIMLFGFSIKEASIYSLLIIIFSQTSKMVVVSFTTGFGIINVVDLSIILFTSVIGGIIGGKLVTKLDRKIIEYLFFAMVIFVILINSLNIVNNI